MELKRNLWVIPTDEPSRLILRKDNKFILRTPITQWHGKNQNICITSDEKPKVGDWMIHTVTLNIYQHYSSESNLRKELKKIILTTDDQLIKCGVQAIDDEFLEWFCSKNPSCEWVEIEKDYSYGNLEHFDYKIIIPKEEPKFEDSIENSLSIMSIANDMFGKKEEPKQETLEEAFKNTYLGNKISFNSDIGKAFELGYNLAKEQDKNKYSEEDMWEAYKAADSIFYDINALKLEFEKWLNNLKRNKI